MDICPICRVNEAKKKNTHLIPWFLIKKYITKGGSGDRDMELSFSIDPKSFTKIYKGRSILPESVEDFDDVESENKNPYARDNIICVECERKISRLEAIFASNFSERKLLNIKQQKGTCIDNYDIIINKKYSSSLFELLIQSIFYRCSIGSFNGFKLRPKVEKKIEENLRKVFLTNGFKKIMPDKNIHIPYKFPIIVTSFILSKQEDPTKNYIVLNNSRIPYFLILGTWTFQLYESENHLKSTVEWLYGLKNKLNPIEIYNVVNDTAHIVLLSELIFKTFSRNLLDHFVTKKNIWIKRTIRTLYFHLFNRKPNPQESEYILRQYYLHRENGKNEFESFLNSFYDLKYFL